MSAIKPNHSPSGQQQPSGQQLAAGQKVPTGRLARLGHLASLAGKIAGGVLAEGAKQLEHHKTTQTGVYRWAS